MNFSDFISGSRGQGRRSKHIDICYHYIRDEILQGHVRLSHIDSASNLADGFTKPLNGQKQQDVNYT